MDHANWLVWPVLPVLAGFGRFLPFFGRASSLSVLRLYGPARA